MSSLDFTAIDFETANGHRTSACSIGIVRVEDGAIRGINHYLIRPYPDFFSRSNIAIHGITASDVRDAPTFAELWPTIRGSMEGKTVVAHWATFDMGVLTETLKHYEVPLPDMDLLCSCLMAKAAFPELPRHSLDIVCDYLNIPLTHHRADSDAEGSASIVLNIAKKNDLSSLEDVRDKLGVIPGAIRDGVYRSVRGPARR